MKPNNKVLFGLLILSSLIFFECDNDEFPCGFEKCTDIYKSVMIAVRNKLDSSAVILTNYKVTRTNNGQDITVSNFTNPNHPEYYPITNDSKLDLLRNKSVEVEFTGYINDVEVLKEKFIITADCCHVDLIEGKTEFYINL